MRICIDARCLMEGRMTGVEEYTLNLLVNLFEIDKKNEYVLFLNSWKEPNNKLEIFKKYPNVKIKRFRFPNKLLNLFFWYLNWPKIDKLVGGADVVFFPNLIFGAVSPQARLAITVHDLSFERHSEYFSFKRKLWHIFINPKSVCRKADMIITVSQSTKNDLVSLYKISPEKIQVVYNAVGEEYKIIDRNDERLVKFKERYKLPYKFILYLGTIEPRKNICAIIKAFDKLHKFAYKSGNQELLKFKLVIAGERGWLNQEIFKEIRNACGFRSIFFIGRVSKENKKYLYNLASLFIYPSFFEGFGFPPLEAMRSGTPVIVSNISSLPEVVGNGGILVDPDKPEEIYQSIKEILLNADLRESLVEKGFKKSEAFNWKKTAAQTLEMISKML